MPKWVRNSSATSRSGARSRPYARSVTLISAMVLSTVFPRGCSSGSSHRAAQGASPGARDLIDPASGPTRCPSLGSIGRGIDDPPPARLHALQIGTNGVVLRRGELHAAEGARIIGAHARLLSACLAILLELPLRS